MAYFLAGDVGGTKTRLAIFASDGGLQVAQAEELFRSADYPTLEAMLQEFMARYPLHIEKASLGVAGPVVAGRASITNLPWQIEERHLEEVLNIPAVSLLNDLDAMAHAIPILRPDDLYTLNMGKATPHGNIALIAPGTGLGEAFLTWTGQHYQTHPSEGGHTDFAPLDELQMHLLRSLLMKFDHVSYEQVCSGIGLPNIYAALKNSSPALEEPAWLAQQLQDAPDPSPIITQAALDTKRPSTLCITTLRMFASILAAEAGNLALKVLATGGVYIGGGIPPRILPFIQEEAFLQIFRQKGRLSELLTPIPVHVILYPKVALMGAAYHNLERWS